MYNVHVADSTAAVATQDVGKPASVVTTRNTRVHNCICAIKVHGQLVTFVRCPAIVDIFILSVYIYGMAWYGIQVFI